MGAVITMLIPPDRASEPMQGHADAGSVPRRHREELIESERGWSGREAFVTMMQTADLGQGNDRSGPGRLNGVVHPVCPCRATSGSLNRDNSRGMSQECAANAAR